MILKKNMKFQDPSSLIVGTITVVQRNKVCLESNDHKPFWLKRKTFEKSWIRIA